jgi:peptidoglycan/LPS O-acetylase OafA/YrhL
MNELVAKREASPVLTGVRFLAAFAVVIYHLQLSHLAAFPPMLAPVVALGRDGVDLFFVLSGYVIAYNYGPWFAEGVTRRWDFLWIRFARIYPLHLVCLLLATPIGLLIVLPSSGMPAPVARVA